MQFSNIKEIIQQYWSFSQFSLVLYQLSYFSTAIILYQHVYLISAQSMKKRFIHFTVKKILDSYPAISGAHRYFHLQLDSNPLESHPVPSKLNSAVRKSIRIQTGWLSSELEGDPKYNWIMVHSLQADIRSISGQLSRYIWRWIHNSILEQHPKQQEQLPQQQNAAMVTVIEVEVTVCSSAVLPLVKQDQI